MTNQPTLKDYAKRMRNLVALQMETAADLRELAKEMRETGFQAAVLKAWVKAIIAFDDGDETPLERLKGRTADVALYGGILGFAVEGFGETNRNVVNNSDSVVKPSAPGAGPGDAVEPPAPMLDGAGGTIDLHDFPPIPAKFLRTPLTPSAHRIPPHPCGSGGHGGGRPCDLPQPINPIGAHYDR